MFLTTVEAIKKGFLTIVQSITSRFILQLYFNNKNYGTSLTIVKKIRQNRKNVPLLRYNECFFLKLFF